MNTDKVMLDPKLAERLQAKNFQMIVFIVAASIFAASILAASIFTIGTVAKLFHEWDLLRDWMVYIPLAFGVAVGYFGQKWNQRRMKRIYEDGTRGVIEEIKAFVSRTYEIDLKEDVRLETIRVGETEKIRINPLSLAAVDNKTGSELRVAVTFRPDHKAVIIRTLTNDEWFDEAAKISNSDSVLF
jgi:hypothetical protein